MLASSSVRVIHRCYNRCPRAPYVRATSILCVRATACVCARALLSAFDGGPRAPMCALLTLLWTGSARTKFGKWAFRHGCYCFPPSLLVSAPLISPSGLRPQWS